MLDTQTTTPRNTTQAPLTREYESRTRPGLKHTVTIDVANLTATCTCEAGRKGRMCWAAQNAILTAEPKVIDYAANRAARRPWVEELDVIMGAGR